MTLGGKRGFVCFEVLERSGNRKECETCRKQSTNKSDNLMHFLKFGMFRKLSSGYYSFRKATKTLNASFRKLIAWSLRGAGLYPGNRERQIHLEDRVSASYASYHASHTETVIQAEALSLRKHICLNSFSNPGMFKRAMSQSQAWLSQCSTSELRCPNNFLQLASRQMNGVITPSSIHCRMNAGLMRLVRSCACMSRSMNNGEYHHLPRQSMRWDGSENFGHFPDSRWLMRLEYVRIGASQAQHCIVADACFVMCCHLD